MQTVTHHDRTTAYRVVDGDGSGSPVLFVHGSGGTHAVWKSQTRRASRHPVVAIDLSGHGASEDVDSEPGWGTISAYASDVIAVAEETGARILVGNSLGGAVVLHIALYRSFDPDALVLVGTGARLAVLDDLLEWLETDFERAVEFLHRPGRLFYDADERLVEESRRQMLECGRTVTRRDFLSGHSFDVRNELQAIDVPCLAVVGAMDRLTPPMYHEFLADRIPHGDWIRIEDAAHLVMLERPTAFNDALDGFVESI